MRKLISLLVLSALFVAMIPLASAQEACSEEDLALGVETLGEGYAAFLALGEVSTDLTSDTYRELAVEYEALAFAHWTEVIPELPQCTELGVTAYVYGRVYDDALNVVLLRWHALYEAENGDEEYAESYLELAETRNESLSNSIQNLGEIAGLLVQIQSGAVPCSEEQVAAYDELFAEYGEYYAELGSDLTEADVDTLADYILEFEGLETGFSEAYGEIICSETFDAALNVSSVFSDSLAVVLLMRTSLIESELGEEEVASYLADQAVQRAEILQATAASIVGE